MTEEPRRVDKKVVTPDLEDLRNRTQKAPFTAGLVDIPQLFSDDFG